jgi:hypothetical protein
MVIKLFSFKALNIIADSAIVHSAAAAHTTKHLSVSHIARCRYQFCLLVVIRLLFVSRLHSLFVG